LSKFIFFINKLSLITEYRFKPKLLDIPDELIFALGNDAFGRDALKYTKEAEALSGIAIDDVKGAKEATQHLIEKGFKGVFITIQDGGVVYSNGDENLFIDAPIMDAVSSTGAGDALMAALTYCFYHSKEIEYSIKFAMAASVLMLKSEASVHSEFSENKIKETMEELGFL